MSTMRKIDQIHLRAVMLCMSKMSKIDQIHLRAVMLCMSKMSKMGKEHRHFYHTFLECNPMYVEDVEDRSNTPKGCNAMYVKDGKRTYTHTFIIPFLNVILCMSKMSKIDQIHLRAVMLCMSKMSKMLKIHQIHLRAVILCMSKMSKMGKEHTHTFWLITSLILKGFSIRKKLSSTCFNIHSI